HRRGLLAARSARRHAARALAKCARTARRPGPRCLAAWPGRRARLAAAADRQQIRQAPRAPRLDSRRRLDAVLQKVSNTEIKGGYFMGRGAQAQTQKL